MWAGYRNSIQRWRRLGITMNPPGFSPRNITGLQLWIDFSDMARIFTDAAKTTPVATDGDVIGAIEDKSGNGNDATQTDAGEKPLYRTNIINGRSVGRFDGINDALEMALDLQDEKTIFISGKMNNTPGGASIYSVLSIKSSLPAISEFSFVNIAGYEEISFRHDIVAAGNSVGIDNVLDTNPHVWSHTYDNGGNSLVGSYTGFIENTGQVIAASGAFSRVLTDVGSIGGRVDNVGVVAVPSDMDFLEIIVYDTVLSVANQQLVRTFMIDKAGL